MGFFRERDGGGSDRRIHYFSSKYVNFSHKYQSIYQPTLQLLLREETFLMRPKALVEGDFFLDLFWFLWIFKFFFVVFVPFPSSEA